MTTRGVEPRMLKRDMLGRDVLYRRLIKDILRGKRPATLFLDNASPFELSVNRLTPKPGQEPPADRPDLASDKVIAQISDRRAKALGRIFYGWAVLSVEDAGLDGRAVHLAPQENNQWHVNIRLPIEAQKNNDIRKRHADLLAAYVKWRPRPSPES